MPTDTELDRYEQAHKNPAPPWQRIGATILLLGFAASGLVYGAIAILSTE